ncbi:MAG TPA: LuxR C-terminal-related transcriptional regulator [Ilumatobacter sp.]|nr:LuxR C-terminal-related transcriptional regulator [Ilumatobacter sp.]
MPTPAGAALTAKESEVLALVQRRMTNAEIAEQLYVSVRTVESHVSSLLRKRGVASRRELARSGGVAPSGPTSVRPLPVLRTALIGRDADVATITKRARADRLTTLVGPGGVGKTSIALAVAHAHTDHWPDGVVFVDLVPARGASDVLQAMADALGIEGAASASSTELGHHLADRSALIVLDNCEHVVDAVARIVHVALGHGGTWHVLATSREPLGLTGEHLVPIDPLADAAAELFVERARQSEPRAVWDVSDPRITDLCDRLDGLPLALELAAGQLRRWSLDELSSRLAARGRRGVPDRPARGEQRHRSMDTAIGWSYDLLDDSEQRVLRHLGVFPSTFDLRTAESLQPLLDGLDVAGTLASLVDKSLVVREPDEDRYRLLETVKAYAVDRLDQHGERHAVFEHHRRSMVDHATATTRLDRWFSGRLAAQQRRDAEHVRQAFWASIEADEWSDAVELATTRSFLWRNAVGCAEGHRWVDALAGASVDGADAAWIALLRSDIAMGDGDFVPMFAAAQESVNHASDVDPGARALALHFAALQHLFDPEQVDRVLADVRAVAPTAQLAALVDAYFLVARGGRLTVEEVEERASALDRACSPDGYERFIFNWAVWINGLALRDSRLARRGIERQYEFLQHVGLPETWLTAYSRAVTQLIDDLAGCEQLARGLSIAHREGYRIEGDCVLALAYAEVCRGNHVVAAELLGLARTRGFNATAHHVLRTVVVEPLVRQGLPLDDYRAAVERGKARSLDATLDEYSIRAG